MCTMDHSCFASLHRAKATGRPRSTSPVSLPREDVLEFDITKSGFRFGHQIKDYFVTVAASLDNHLLELFAGRDACGML